MRRSASSRWLTLLATLWLPLLLGGCLDYEEVLTLNPDGGGRLEAELTIDMGLLRRLSLALGEELEDEAFAGPSRGEVQAALSVEGVTIRELRVEARGTQTWIRLAVDVADLEALHRVDAFAVRRRLELYDHGAGQVLLVSRFDPREVIPLPEVARDWAGERGLAPHEAQALEEAVRELRRTVRLRSELRLPGPIVASNGHPHAARPGLDLSAWEVDDRRSPERQAELGRYEVLMKVLCERTSVPWVQELPPVPPEVGSVVDDALAPGSSVAPVVTASEAPPSPGGARGRRGAGCSAGAESSRGSPWALGALLLGGLVLLRHRPSSGPEESRSR